MLDLYYYVVALHHGICFRFYSKFHSRRMQELSETGLNNLTTLFLSLTYVVSLQDLVSGQSDNQQPNISFHHQSQIMYVHLIYQVSIQLINLFNYHVCFTYLTCLINLFILHTYLVYVYFTCFILLAV